MRVCKIKGCEKIHYGRGLCREHYNRWKRGKKVQERLEKARTKNLKDEVWKKIEEFPRYVVSNYGRVKRKQYIGEHGKGTQIRSEKLINPSKNPEGYLQLSLYNGIVTKSFRVHRLVAKAFIPNPNELKEVNHKNGVKDDNRVKNLEWISKQDNIKHSREVLKNTHGARQIICLETNEKFHSIAEASRRMGISSRAINNQLKGWQKVCRGKHFKYIDK